MSNIAVQLVTIDRNNAGQRIDNFLLSKLKGVPKSRIYRILRKGEVRVNKKRVKPDYRLAIDDEVRIPPVRMSETKTKLTPDKKAMSLLDGRILFQDDDVMVINKPAGLAVHAGSGVDYGLIDILQAMFPEERLSLVHRLDRGTSGCILIAKHRDALLALHEGLKAGAFTKVYTLLVKGEFMSDKQTIDAPIETKDAVTHFECLERFTDASLLLARIDTGRTHQIRIHAESLGHPLAGDERYGNVAFNKGMRHYGLKRLFLHASKLTIRLPGGGLKTVEALLDDDLITVLKELP